MMPSCQYNNSARALKKQYSITEYTDVEEVSDKAVSDDGDGALPQRGAEQLRLRVERAAQHSEADQSVYVEDDQTQYRHPQQRFTYTYRQRD